MSTSDHRCDHPSTFPRPRHALRSDSPAAGTASGPVEQFRDGEPHAVQGVRRQARRLGAPTATLNVLDGYCRHMGGDLTQGTVKGDEIACPFHDWRWGGDGKCKAIPYARRIPLRARTQKYETAERNGLLMVWHDPEGSAADHDVLPPELEDIMRLRRVHRLDLARSSTSRPRTAARSSTTSWTWRTSSTSTSPSRRTSATSSRATWPRSSWSRPGRPDMAGEGYGDEDLVLKSEATYFGPSFMINWLKNDYKGFVTDVVLINCHIPTSDNSFVLQYGLKVLKPEGVDEKTTNYIGERYSEMFGEGFMQDVHIWLNKAPVQNPLLCEEDGPVYQLRRWYEQFYVDKADVTPEMTERFEFEVDTTKANEYWRAEVAENLAKKAAEDEAPRRRGRHRGRASEKVGGPTAGGGV